jgi:hypothetical protein
VLYALSRGGLGSIGALAAGAALVSRASANRPLAGMLPQRATQAAFILPSAGTLEAKGRPPQ